MMVAQFQCFPSPLMWCETNGPLAPSAVAGLERWFRAEDLTGTDNSPFTSWTDTAGIQAATQPVGTSQPTLKHNGAFHYIRHDGVDDFMDYGELLNAMTLFAVVRYWNSATNAAVIFGHESFYDLHGGHSAHSEQDKVLSSVLAISSFTGGRALLNGVPSTPATIVKPATFAVIAFRGSTDPARLQNFANDRAGSLAPIDLMEAAIYSTSLTDGQMDRVATWLANKFVAYV